MMNSRDHRFRPHGGLVASAGRWLVMMLGVVVSSMTVPFVLPSIAQDARIVIAQQVPRADSRARAPLAPGSDVNKQFPGSGSDIIGITQLTEAQRAAAAERARLARAIAVGLLTEAAARTVGGNTLLLVNTTQGAFNLEYKRDGTWVPLTLEPAKTNEIACTSCVVAIELRYDDTANVQNVSFNKGSKAALIWSAAASKFQLLPLAVALAQFQAQ